MTIYKDDILDNLNAQLNYLISEKYYDAKQILGIFLYGSQNYGFATPMSDVDSIAIVLPTFENFCLNQIFISKEYEFEYKVKEDRESDEYILKKEHIVVKDFNTFREYLIKQSSNYIETLYTKYFILSANYKTLFNRYFVNNKEVISHLNREAVVRDICNRGLHYLKTNVTNKKLYNAIRCFIFAKNYLNGESYQNCLYPRGKEHDILWSIKFRSGEEKVSTEEIEKVKYDLTSLLYNNHSDLSSPDYGEAMKALNTGTIKILRHNFRINLSDNLEEQIERKNIYNGTF